MKTDDKLETGFKSISPRKIKSEKKEKPVYKSEISTLFLIRVSPVLLSVFFFSAGEDFMPPVLRCLLGVRQAGY